MHNMHPPPEFDLKIVLDYLPKNFFLSPAIGSKESDDAVQPEIDLVAFMMALFGWTGRPGNNIRDGAATCTSCFRTLGLWLFKSKEVNEAGEIVREATITHLDPVKEHREYCSWRNEKSQSGSVATKNSAQAPELAAWEIVLRVLKNSYLLRTGGENRPDRAKQASGAEIPVQADPDHEDAQSIREEKDKERWVRLRRVKSLFDTKSTKKMQRNPPISDPKAKGPS
jgi:hypothetical protein